MTVKSISVTVATNVQVALGSSVQFDSASGRGVRVFVESGSVRVGGPECSASVGELVTAGHSAAAPFALATGEDLFAFGISISSVVQVTETGV